MQYEIQCPIYGLIAFTEKEIAILDHQALQRLRYISQLGFASFVFPGATHFRFSHSLGTLYVVAKKWEYMLLECSTILSQHYEQEQQDYFYTLLRLAALVHDTGHFPFSHAAESLLPLASTLPLPSYLPRDEKAQATHEDYTALIILRLAKDALISQEEADDVIALLNRKVKPSDRFHSKTGEPSIVPLLRQLISGEADADRMDYLRRDAYYTGVPYGVFDIERLLRCFTCYYDEEQRIFRLVIHENDVPVYENFLLARMHMFRKVYFHSLLGSFIYCLQKAVEEKEIIFPADSFTNLDSFLVLTEPYMYELFRKNQDKKWIQHIWQRKTARRLLNYDMAIIDRTREEIVNQVAFLQDNGVACFFHESTNSYTKQTKEVNENTIMVASSSLGKEKYFPLYCASPLLQNDRMKIQLYHVYALSDEDVAKAKQLLAE